MQRARRAVYASDWIVVAGSSVTASVITNDAQKAARTFLAALRGQSNGFTLNAVRRLTIISKLVLKDIEERLNKRKWAS